MKFPSGHGGLVVTRKQGEGIVIEDKNGCRLLVTFRGGMEGGKISMRFVGARGDFKVIRSELLERVRRDGREQ